MTTPKLVLLAVVLVLVATVLVLAFVMIRLTKRMAADAAAMSAPIADAVQELRRVEQAQRDYVGTVLAALSHHGDLDKYPAYREVLGTINHATEVANQVARRAAHLESLR